MVRQGLEKIYLHVKVDNEEGQALFERSGYEEPADAKAGLTQFQVRSIQKFFTHRSVSTFDRSPFQLTLPVNCPQRARRRRRGVVDPVHRALRALRRLDARLRVVLEQRAEERAVPRDDVLHRAAPDAGVSRRLARDARDLDPSVRAEAAREPRVLLDV